MLEYWVSTAPQQLTGPMVRAVRQLAEQTATRDGLVLPAIRLCAALNAADASTGNPIQLHVWFTAVRVTNVVPITVSVAVVSTVGWHMGLTILGHS